MDTTTSYGTWNNRVERYCLTVEQSVVEAFGAEGPEGFDTDAIAAEYRAAINAALPPGVSLCGNEFIGPYYDADRDFDSYPLDEDGGLDIGAIVESVDFWGIASRHQA